MLPIQSYLSSETEQRRKARIEAIAIQPLALQQLAER